MLHDEAGADLLAQRRSGIGRYAGDGWIAEDFDDPLPADIQKYFEGDNDETAVACDFEVAHLPDIHRDPFDRIVVAQARVEGLTLVTADPRVRSYPVATLSADA